MRAHKGWGLTHMPLKQVIRSCVNILESTLRAHFVVGIGEFMSGGIWRIWNAGIQSAAKFIMNSNSLFDSFRNSRLRIQSTLNS